MEKCLTVSCGLAALHTVTKLTPAGQQTQPAFANCPKFIFQIRSPSTFEIGSPENHYLTYMGNRAKNKTGYFCGGCHAAHEGLAFRKKSVIFRANFKRPAGSFETLSGIWQKGGFGCYRCG